MPITILQAIREALTPALPPLEPDYGTVEALATYQDALDHPGEIQAGDVMVLDADTGAFLFAYTPR